MSRQSFRQWLMQKHKVLGACENVSAHGELENGTGINYIFAADADAIAFVTAFGIRAYDSPARPAADDSVVPNFVFRDSLYPQHFAVHVDKDSHLRIRERHQFSSPDAKADQKANGNEQAAITVRKQFDLINDAIQNLSLQAESARKPLAEHLQYLGDLALRQESMQAFEVITAFQLLLKAYAAYYYNPEEYDALKTAYDSLTNLKQDGDWWDHEKNNNATRLTSSEPPHFDIPYLEDRTAEDAGHHVYGVEQRIIVSENPLFRAPLVADEKDEAALLQRDIPVFSGNRDAKPIVIRSGGMNGHTVTCFWKEGVDAKGVPVTDPAIKPDHFKYYRTVHNAGVDAPCHTGPKWDNTKRKATVGTVYTTATYEIRPDTTDEKQKAQTLADIIQAERMITCYKPPLPYESKADGIPAGWSVPGSVEAQGYNKWKAVIDKNCSRLIREKSRYDRPQISGDCTALSVKSFLMGMAPQLGSHALLLAEVWLAAKEFGSQLVVMLKDQALSMKAAWNQLQPIDKIKASIEAGNTVEALKLLRENKHLANATYGAEQNLFTILAIDKAFFAENATECKKYLDFLKAVFEIADYNINAQQGNGNTLLHRIAMLASMQGFASDCRYLMQFQDFAKAVRRKFPNARVDIINRAGHSVSTDPNNVWFKENVLIARTANAVAADVKDAPGGGAAASAGSAAGPLPALSKSTGPGFFAVGVSAAAAAAGASAGAASASAGSAANANDGGDHKVNLNQELTTAVHKAYLAYDHWYQCAKLCSTTIGIFRRHGEEGQERASTLYEEITEASVAVMPPVIALADSEEEAVDAAPKAPAPGSSSNDPIQPKLVQLLLNHLQRYSARLRNHSFDTFLLTAIQGSIPLAAFFKIGHVPLKFLTGTCQQDFIDDKTLLAEAQRAAVKQSIIDKLKSLGKALKAQNATLPAASR